MKIIDGRNAVLGRIASYVAKESLKGEEIIILNCEQIIITGGRRNIQKNFEERKKKIGSGQKGPKHSKLFEKIVKRAIRGMLPTHRKGRGKVAFKKIKCCVGIPHKFKENKEIIWMGEQKKKFVSLKEI